MLGECLILQPLAAVEWPLGTRSHSAGKQVPAKEPGVVKHRLTGFRWPVLGKLGERTHPVCCLRHLAANVRQHKTSGPTDVGVLMAVGRKRMRSAFPPDHRPGRYPTLTRLGLVQRWAVLEIPVGDQLRSGAAAKEPARCRSSSSKRMGLQAQRWRASSEPTLGMSVGGFYSEGVAAV